MKLKKINARNKLILYGGLGVITFINMGRKWIIVELKIRKEFIYVKNAI